jgi:DNA mismatch repair protein MutS2
LQQAEQFYQEVSQKAADLQAREQNLKIAQEQVIQAELDQAKATIAQVIRKLQQGPQTAQSAQQATASLNQLANGQKTMPVAIPIGYQPHVGERIRVPRLGQTAEVLTLADDQGNLQVRFGLMKVSVSLADVESLTGEKPKIPVKPAAVKAKPKEPSTETEDQSKKILPRTSQNTVDVRGQRVDAAILEIDRAMNAAYASGVMWIIHGKGTGKLRQGVHDFLMHSPQVKGFELADNSDGGAGVTVTRLS